MFAAFSLFMLFSARFSNWPGITLRDSEQSILSLTFSHAGQRVHECRKLTQAELDELPPNMRKPEDCQRERHPVDVVFSVDDTVLYQESLPPTGIWGDGKITVYKRILIAEGERRIFIGLRDDNGQEYDYEYTNALTFEAGQHLVIDFDSNTGTFSIN